MSGLFAGTPLEQPVTCEHCGQPADTCPCPRDAAGRVRVPSMQSPRVRREKRRGKWNTIVADIAASPDPGSTDLKPLLKTLRTNLGTGGGLGNTADGSPEIVLQGDHRDAVVTKLVDMGYNAKPAGG